MSAQPLNDSPPVAATTVRVLLVEDSPADAELVLLELRRAGFTPEAERVDTPATMGQALERRRWDAIIADYRLPGWSGLAALKLLQERETDLPFILVSGAVGEDAAVEAMRAGAHDYVLKQNMVRLGPAVSRELREAAVRRERRQALIDLKELASRSAFLAEASRRLSQSLNYQETLEKAVGVAVPAVADWCLLMVREDWNERPRLLISHRDPVCEARARLAIDRHGLAAGSDRGVKRVALTGEAEWATGDTALGIAGPADERNELVAALGFASGLTVPLQAHGHLMGALTVVRGPARRPFETEDRGFIEELATRSAMALDNADLYRRAREAVRARDEFLSVASHELNTPLATLTLQIDELLVDGAVPRANGTPPPPGLERARRQLDRLSRLVGNLLDVSRISSRRLQLRLAEMDLAATTREVVDQFGPELRRAGCSVAVDGQASVLGRWDGLRVAQIVANLVSNACKYGAGQPIEITVGSENGEAHLVVRDHGIGIPTADQARIFECFERAVSPGHYGGLGLGLYITRQLVEAHGGSIAVSSLPGSGATFAVTLPRVPAAGDAAS